VLVGSYAVQLPSNRETVDWKYHLDWNSLVRDQLTTVQQTGFIPYLVKAVTRLDGYREIASTAFEHPNVVLVFLQASPNLFHSSKVAAIVD